METTAWEYPNHIYLFSDKKTSKVSGYIKNGTKEIIMFKKPMPFTKTRRTFKEIKV